MLTLANNAVKPQSTNHFHHKNTFPHPKLPPPSSTTAPAPAPPPPPPPPTHRHAVLERDGLQGVAVSDVVRDELRALAAGGGGGRRRGQGRERRAAGPRAQLKPGLVQQLIVGRVDRQRGEVERLPVGVARRLSAVRRVLGPPAGRGDGWRLLHRGVLNTDVTGSLAICFIHDEVNSCVSIGQASIAISYFDDVVTLWFATLQCCQVFLWESKDMKQLCSD